jgi:hypothetical protein
MKSADCKRIRSPLTGKHDVLKIKSGEEKRFKYAQATKGCSVNEHAVVQTKCQQVPMSLSSVPSDPAGTHSFEKCVIRASELNGVGQPSRAVA